MHPWALLAYNLSPSFNWSAAGMTDEQIAAFQDELGRHGYVWQFITVAGFHINGLITESLARDFATRRMLAYVQRVQREEEKCKVETLTHQKWSGANLIDGQLKAVTGGRYYFILPEKLGTSSTLSMGAGVTERQFDH